MFQKNLEVLRMKNPALATKLEKINLDSLENIEVVEAESKDLIINYNKVNLHSSLDPVREAKTTWHRTIKNDLRINDIQIVFGLGLGYLFKRAYISSSSKIFIIEPFTEVLRFVLEYVDLSVELSDNRVFITDNLEELTQKLKAEFLSGDRVEFLFLNSHAALAQDVLVKLTQATVEICESKSSDQNTIFNLCKSWVKNSILNMSHFPESRPVGFFEGTFAKKTALIVSPGPSLASQVEKIKQNRDKFIIIAVAPVLKYLINNGIIPDFATFTDAIPNYLARHTEGIKDDLSKINLVINTRAEDCIIRENFKSKLIYFSETDTLITWFKAHMGDDIGIYKSGGTVSILSYYFAKALGFDLIAFAGLDLAILDGKIYADGQEAQITAGGFYIVPNEYMKKLVQVKSYNGQTLTTRDDYALFIRQFEEIFTQEHNPARIINTSTNGALINGMEYMEFDDLLNAIASQNSVIDQELSSVTEKTQDKWLQLNSSIYQDLKNQYEVIKKIDQMAKPVQLVLEEICSLFEEQGDKNASIQAKIESIKDNLAQVRSDVISNVFLSTYLQGEVWKYTQQYKINAIPKLEDVKDNLQLELDFFTSICWATENIIQCMEESLPILEGKIHAVKL